MYFDVKYRKIRSQPGPHTLDIGGKTIRFSTDGRAYYYKEGTGYLDDSGDSVAMTWGTTLLVQADVIYIGAKVIYSNSAATPPTEALDKGEKYRKTVYNIHGDMLGEVDVYDVCDAWELSCPAMTHAVKKLLATGTRGHKDFETDALEAINSIHRSIQLNRNKQTKEA